MFRTTAHGLAVALAKTLPVARYKASIPILTCVRLRAETGGLTLTATDLDNELAVEASAELDGPSAEIAVSPHRMLGVLRLLPRGDAVEIALDGETLVMSWNGGRCRIRGLPAADLPEMEMGNDSVGAELDGAANDALGRVIPYISSEETRYYLNGVCLDAGMLVATDGHRLCAMPGGAGLAGLSAQMGEARPIVPRDAVRLWRAIAEGGDVRAAFWGTRFISVERPGLRLRAKLIDGKFPPWRRVVPDRSDKVLVELPRLALLSACRIAATVNEAFETREGALVFEGGRGQIQSRALDDELAVDFGAVPGLSAVVGVNLRYLAQALVTARGRTVKLWIGQEGMEPMPIEGSEAGPGEHLIVMPMRASRRTSFSAPELVLAA